MNIERQLFLRTMVIGRAAGAAEHLAGLMKDAYFPAGTALYRAGEACDQLFFIVRGEVHLVSPGLDPLIFGARSVIGVLDMLQDRPYSRTAVAVTDVEGLTARADDWLEMLEENFEFGRSALVNNASGLVHMASSLPRCGFPPEGVGGAPLPINEKAGAELDLVGRLLALRAVPAFSMARIQALTSMAELAEQEQLAPGAMLFQQGEVPSAIYVIVRGKIELVAGSFSTPVPFGAGTLVGNYAAFSERPLPFGARAVEPTTLLRIRTEDLLDLMEIHFEVARSAMAYVANERIRILEYRAELAAAAPPSSGDVAQVVPLPVGA
jgi:CRP-like cAMP-binding protein